MQYIADMKTSNRAKDTKQEEPQSDSRSLGTFFLPYEGKVVQAETLEQVVELNSKPDNKEEDGDGN